MLGLRYCTMICKNAEYKNMDQGESQGQLYDVQNEIKILYKARVGPTHFLRHWAENSCLGQPLKPTLREYL